MPTPLGEKIYELRRKKGLTLEKLAELTDSSKSYIWELENKNPPRPSADKIGKIAAVLGVTSEFLLDTSEKSPTPDVEDKAFFRKYQKLEPEVKAKIRSIVEVWDKEKK
jgi:transcriptional regulator with XRE-family HTH domain